VKPKLLTTLRDYSWRLFVGDALAGVTVALVALPLSIAIAIASGADPNPKVFGTDAITFCKREARRCEGLLEVFVAAGATVFAMSGAGVSWLRSQRIETAATAAAMLAPATGRATAGRCGARWSRCRAGRSRRP